MGRVVAIGGFPPEGGNRLIMHAMELTGKEHPNMLYVPTAQMDSAASVEGAVQRYGALGCQVKSLCLVEKSYTDGELDDLFSWADLIYVGGGDTISMMRIWRERGLDKRLKQIYKDDAAVLAGISAGAICWFGAGHSDSESFHKKDGWSFCFAEGMLSLFPEIYCPHYNEPGRNTFDEMLQEKGDAVGLAVDNGAAFVECGDKHYFIRCTPAANVYRMQYVGGELQKAQMEIRNV